MSKKTTSITTSQTVGPFPHEAWKWAVDATARTDSGAPCIVISGNVTDGDGAPINDAWVEAWMPAGVTAESAQNLPGFRRVSTDDAGGFTLKVTLPLPPQGKPVAHITLFARGLIKHQFSAVFLDDDAALAQSSLLAQVPAARRNTLLARKQADGSYRWDIRLQGADETVFFDYT